MTTHHTNCKYLLRHCWAHLQIIALCSLKAGQRTLLTFVVHTLVCFYDQHAKALTVATICRCARHYLIKAAWVILPAFITAYPHSIYANPFKTRSLQEKITQLELETDSLPDLLLNPTPWTLGYRSQASNNADEPITIDLWFTTPASIDLIALLPTTYSPTSAEVAAFGFPEKFTIEPLLRDGSSEIIVDYSQQEYTVTGIEPQLFRLRDPVFADGIRITVLRRRANPWVSHMFITNLGEVFAFSGDWNVALGATAKVSSEAKYGYLWSSDALVDGFSIFSPISGDFNSPFDNFYYPGEELTLRFDLGENQPVDELRIWPEVHTSRHHIPQASGSDFPTKIRLERLDGPKATTGQILFNTGEHPPRPGSGPYMIRFPTVQGRYFRLTLRDPTLDFRADLPPQFALSEIEMLMQGKLLTRARPPIIENRIKRRGKDQKLFPQRSKNKILPERLTDGHTTGGEIIPLRPWIEGLNRRAILERQRSRLQEDLRFAQRQERERLLFIILLFLCLTPILIWLVKLRADRQWNRVRDRIAGDLHDEIGANVSSLSHMTELIKETISEPNDVQTQILDEAIYTARRTAGETRTFIQLLEADKSVFDLNIQIGKVAQQILGNIDFTSKIEAGLPLARLRAYRQWDLLLFVKEALNNIIKHADASHVGIRMCRRAGRIELSISDNGRGIPDDRLPLRHLETRAKQLRGNLKVESILGQGTKIILNFK